MLKSLILATVLALAGCAATSTAAPPAGGTAPATAPAFSDASAGRAMAAARVSYNAAVTTATEYARLPACSETQHAPCSNPVLVAQLRKAEVVAFGALDAADVIIKRPALGASATNAAVAAAQSALTAFVTLTGATK